MSSHGTILTLVGDISQTYHHLPLTSDEGFRSEESEVYKFRDMCLKGHKHADTTKKSTILQQI